MLSFIYFSIVTLSIALTCASSSLRADFVDFVSREILPSRFTTTRSCRILSGCRNREELMMVHCIPAWLSKLHHLHLSFPLLLFQTPLTNVAAGLELLPWMRAKRLRGCHQAIHRAPEHAYYDQALARTCSHTNVTNRKCK